MSRKAQTDSGETKRSLVASATEEFAEYGYEGASLRQICSKAGVTTGALYFFFDSKEDLFKSVVSPLMTEFPSILATWIEHDLSVICDGKGEPTNVEQLPDGLAELLEQYPLVPKIVMSNRDNPVVKGYLDAKVDEIAQSIASRAERKDGHASDGFSPRLLATMCADAFIEVLANNDDLDVIARHLSEVSAFVRGGLEAALKK
jgi:AcrR family transcriptional regulator